MRLAERRVGLGVVVFVVTAVAHCTYSLLLSAAEPEPYMDEMMHVPLGQRACNLELSRNTYDSRVTTPPALYVVTAPLARALGKCSPTRLRAANALLSSFSAFPIFSGCRSFTVNCPQKCALLALAGSFNPVLLQCSAMYYTDGLASLLVLSAHSLAAYLARHRAFLPAALTPCALYAVATLTRQSVAPFSAFTAVSAALASESTSSKQRPLTRRTLTLLPKLVFFGLTIPSGSLAVLLYIAYITGGSFALGDKSAHSLSLHFAQLAYAGSFACLSLAPLHFVRFSSRLSDFLTSAHQSMRLMSLQVVFALCVRFGTVEHPYLLADNRHYTFYIFRRVLKRLGIFGSSLHALFAELLLESLSLNTLGHIALIVSTAASVVPLPLFEPRYLLLPALLAIMHTDVPQNGTGALMSSVLINAWTCALQLYTFANYTFMAPNGSTGRFVW